MLPRLSVTFGWWGRKSAGRPAANRRVGALGMSSLRSSQGKGTDTSAPLFSFSRRRLLNAARRWSRAESFTAQEIRRPTSEIDGGRALPKILRSLLVLKEGGGER